MAKRFYGHHNRIGASSANYYVDIYDDAFGGAATEFDIAEPGIEIDYSAQGEEDRHSPIFGSKCTFKMAVPVGDATLEAFVAELATSEEAKFFVEVTRTGSPDPLWRGILLADTSIESDEAAVFGVKLVAVDGLALLKKEPYYNTATEEIYTGRPSLVAHLVTALKKLPHTSHFWTGTDIFLRTAVDWWADTMTASASTDPLALSAADHAAFYDFKTKGGTDKDVKSCYDVVAGICLSFGCRIKMHKGAWWVEQIPYRSAASYYTRHYDVDGAYLSNATNTGVVTVDQTATGAKLSTVEFDYLPQLKKAEVTYESKSRRNVFGNILLTMADSTHDFDQEIDANSGDLKFRVRGILFVSIKNNSYSGNPSDVLFLVMRMRLKVGGRYLNREITISNFQAQLGPYEWTTTSTDAMDIPINMGQVPPTGITDSGVAAFDFITPALPADASDNHINISVGSIKKWDGTDAALGEFTVTWSASGFYIETYDQGTPDVVEDEVLYAYVNPDGGTEVWEAAIPLGGATTPNAVGRLVDTGGSTNWAQWGEGTGTRDKPLGGLLARSVINGQLTPIKRMSGEIRAELIDPNKIFETLDGRQWLLMRGTWNLYYDTVKGVWAELNYGTAGVASTPVKIKKVVGPQGPTVPSVEPSGFAVTTTNVPGFHANPPPTVLAPIAYNSISDEILEGATVTSIPINTPSEGNEFLAGDIVTLIHPVLGKYQDFTISTPPTVGATSLSVNSVAAQFDAPVDSYLVVKQKAFAFSLPNANQGEILRYNDSTDAWEAYGGTTDGHVLTWDATNGWQHEAAPGVSDGDKGDITVSGGGTNWQIDAGAVGAAELADDAVTFAKIQNISTDRLLGRDTAGSGDVEEISLGASLEFSGSGSVQRAALTGDVTAAANGNATTIANNAVTDAKLRDSIARSVIGRAGNTTGDPADIQGTSDQVLRVDTAGTGLAFGTVATGGIANDAVTYAKIQNVSATNRVLGRITAGAGDVEELTAANLYTLMSISIANTRVLVGTGANSVGSSANFTYSTANDRLSIASAAAGTGAGAATLNLGTVGTVAGPMDLLGVRGTVNGNLGMALINLHNASVNSNSIFQIASGGASAGDALMQFTVSGVMSHAIGIDNSDGDKFKITPNASTPGATANMGIIVRDNSGVGNTGINRDTPIHPLDITGRCRANEFIGVGEDVTSGNFAFDTGAGTGPVLNAIIGTGNSAKVTFTTGTAPANNGTVFTLSYTTTFPTNSLPVIGQGNANAATDINKFYVDAHSGNSFTVKANGTLSASTQYVLFFNIMGY